MAVPYTFASATGSIPLSQLDANFNTGITIGNTSVLLGGAISTINNLSLSNVTITSVNQAFPNGYLANSNVVLGTTTLTLGSTTTTVDGLTLSNVVISSGNVTISNVTTTNVSATTANVSGTANISNLVVIGNATVGGNTTVTGNISANVATLTTAGVGAAPVTSKGTFQVGTISYTDTGVVAGFASSIAGYNQVVLQNTSNNSGASTNFNISNDAGTTTTNFGELGINSSTFTGTGAFSQAGYVYLASASTDLVVGTYASKSIHFVVNSGATDALTIDTANSLNLGGAYTEAVVVNGTVTTTKTLSLASGTVQTATLTASTACTFTMPTATAGKSFILLLKQAASTGNGTATFTSVKWGTAGAPTITATAGKMDILTFVADGTNWYGSAAQGYTP